MKKLYIANTNFEFELNSIEQVSLQDSLEQQQHPLLLQLQFLPILFAESSDIIAVTALPDKNYIDHLLTLKLWSSIDSMPTFITLDAQQQQQQKFPHIDQIISWGNSPQVASWANKNHIPYFIPPCDVTKRVNSKVFSFQNSPKLPHAKLLLNIEELQNWLKQNPGSCVLKNSFGFSGKGNLVIKDSQKISIALIKKFCEREWDNQRPVIAEPWVDRVYDFSTQWKIEPHGEILLLGATRIKNNALGSYQSTSSGPQDKLFSDTSSQMFLKEHCLEAQKILKKMKAEGYFGYAGVDVMVYRNSENLDNLILQPIVEVNARQTMSLAALLFQRKWYPDKVINLSYTKKQRNRPGLLPNSLRKRDGTEIVFSRQLYCD